MFDFLNSILKIATAATDTASGLSSSTPSLSLTYVGGIFLIVAGFVLVVVVTGIIFLGVSSAEPKIKPPEGMTKAG